jgi:outer membrane protein assembly factor BamD
MRFVSKWLVFVLFACSLVLLTACTSQEERFKHMSETELYQGGLKSLQKHDYADAIAHFEAQEAQFSYGPDARSEQLIIIYAYYMNDDYPSAFSAAQRYIHLYPQGENVDYAFYMQGLSSYAEARTFLENYFPADMAERDLTQPKAAFAYFNDFVNQYPESVYAPDARQHMIFIRNAIARNDLHTAQYYYKRKAYVAALNRAHRVVYEYQGAPAIPEALVVMYNCYQQLALPKDAAATREVIAENYPQLLSKLITDKAK